VAEGYLTSGGRGAHEGQLRCPDEMDSDIGTAIIILAPTYSM
jgi:hypothetical protein